MTVARDVLSTEYIVVDVFASVDPLSDNVRLALVTDGDDPDAPAWLDSSEWVPGQTWVSVDTPVKARVLVGPVGGDMTLDRGKLYAVKCKVTDSPEVPVFTAYTLAGS